MANYITQNIKMVRGDTESFGFEVTGVSTLDTAFFSCKKNSQDDTYIFQKSLDNGITADSSGKYIVRIAPVDTVTMEPGEYWYDLEIGANDDIFTIIRGVLEIVPEITDSTSTVFTSVNWGNITGTLSDQNDLQAALSAKASTNDLATVATTGSYNDLIDIPAPPQPTITLDDIYPVGTYYWSTENTNPGTLFGIGTWLQVKDKFILAAGDTYIAGNTGGASTHTLTENEMPNHNHRTCDNSNFYYAWAGSETPDGPANGSGYSKLLYDLNTGTAGGGAAHNNMPPYEVAYCFKRVA